MFFDVVMKVLTFIVSAIRVKLPKITLHLLCFVSDDLWMFCVSVVLFLFKFSVTKYLSFFLRKYIFNPLR